MKKSKIFNYSETTYGVQVFGAVGLAGRVDVTYYARLRSKNAMVLRILKLPHMINSTDNWIRQRVQEGSGGMEKVITDDAIYIETEQGSKIIGKFTVDNEWIPFDPPLKAHRPWLDKFKQPDADRKFKLKDLIDAKIVGYSWTGKLDTLQIRTSEGKLLNLVPNGSVSDKRFSVGAWIEVQTDSKEKLL